MTNTSVDTPSNENLVTTLPDKIGFQDVLNFVVKILRAEYENLGTWEKVELEYKRPKGSLWRIANQPGYCPNWLRNNINKSLQVGKDLYSMSVVVLRHGLENRVRVK